MIKEVEYDKSPVFMDKAELKKEVWRLKGLIEKKENEIKLLRVQANANSQDVKMVIDKKWEGRYRNLLAMYKSVKEKKPMPVEYCGNQEDIVNAVLNYYSVSLENLKSKSRKRKYVRPRHVLFYLLYSAGLTTEDIGRIFNRDHSTVIHGRDVVINEIETFNKGEQELIKILTEK